MSTPLPACCHQRQPCPAAVPPPRGTPAGPVPSLCQGDATLEPRILIFFLGRGAGAPVPSPAKPSAPRDAKNHQDGTQMPPAFVPAPSPRRNARSASTFSISPHPSDSF